MLLIIALVLVVAVGIGIYLEQNNINFGGGFIMALICGALLFILLIVWPISYADNISMMQKYHTVKQTVETARTAEIDPLERAALTQEIIKINSWLANVQYWNNTIFGQAIPDAVTELEPLK